MTVSFKSLQLQHFSIEKTAKTVYSTGYLPRSYSGLSHCNHVLENKDWLLYEPIDAYTQSLKYNFLSGMTSLRYFARIETTFN